MTMDQQEEAEARSLLVTALPKAERETMRTLPMSALVREAMDGLARQVQGSTKDHESEGKLTGHVPEIILSDDERLVRLDDVIVESFSVSLATANKKIQAGRIKLNGEVLQPKDPHVPTTLLQGRILQLDKRLVRIRATCTCSRKGSRPGRHDRTCPVRTHQ